jgi:hypothetical protein
MPKGSKAQPSREPRQTGARFRRSYDELERRRAELMARLGRLRTYAGQHEAYDRALKLLNTTFRKSSLTQRIAVLDAASWFIDVLEQLTFMV